MWFVPSRRRSIESADVNAERSPVVVTGAAGNLGSRLVPWLEAAGREVRPIDIRPVDHPRAVIADLAGPGGWEASLVGARAVIHLAGFANSRAPWSAVEGPNVATTRNVVRAAQVHGVERLVFASSVWAMRERWEAGGMVSAGPAQPGELAYGRSKALAEAIVADGVGSGLSSVVLRLGGRNPGDARPVRLDAWEDSCWLGWNDFLHGIACAVDADVDGLATVNLVSLDRARRWSAVEAREQIGFIAREHYDPVPGPGRLRKVGRRLLRRASFTSPSPNE